MPVCTCVPSTTAATSPRLDPQRGLLGICPLPAPAPRKASGVCIHRFVGRLLPLHLVFEKRGRQNLVTLPRLPWPRVFPYPRARRGFPLVLHLRGFLLPRGASLGQRPAVASVPQVPRCLGVPGGARPCPSVSEDPVCSGPPCSDPTGLTTPLLIIGTDLGGPTAQVPQQGSLLALKVTSEAFSASLLTLGLILLKSFPNPPQRGWGGGWCLGCGQGPRGPTWEVKTWLWRRLFHVPSEHSCAAAGVQLLS